MNLLVDLASGAINTYTNRILEATDHTDYHDGDAQVSITLHNYPVNTFTSIQKNEGDLQTPDRQDVEAIDYDVDKTT